MKPGTRDPSSVRREGTVSGRAAYLELSLYACGAGCASIWLQSMFPWPAVFAAAAAASGLRWMAAHSKTRIVRWGSAAALAGLFAVWTYLAIIFGWLLAWTVPWPVRLGLGALVLVAAATARMPIRGVRIPLVLPVGIWIAVCLFGWQREDGAIRCDDYIRFEAQPSIELVAPSTRDLAACAPGTTLRLRRYPRRLWEAPDGRRLVVTTQEGIDFWPYGTAVGDPITDGICEFGRDGERHCVGGDAYKMQLILDAPTLDRLFLAGWGSGHGGLFAVPRSAPLRIVDEVQTDGNTGSGYYDAHAGEIGLLADECSGLRRYRASDLAPLEPVDAPFCPGETHYEASHSEGIFCFAPGPLGPIQYEAYGFLSVAFRGNPFSHRLLGASPADWWSYAALVWACEFDPEQRVAWVATANLGLIAVVDYDNGKVMDTWWSEPGLRSAEFDSERRLLYVTNFLRGDVIAIDIDDGRLRQRWFVGRFARFVALSRDRRALWAPSSLGIARIDLTALAAR